MAVVAQAPVQRSKKTQPLIVRITHWVNAVAMVIMIGSGWRIFNDSPLIPGFIFHPDITLGGDVYLSQQMWQDSGMGGALQWHFAGMWLLVLNGLVYLVFGIASGHFRHGLWVSARELRNIPHSIWEHIRLRFPKGDEARHYNVLQKLTYLVVMFIVIPVMVLTGMTMSPGLNARFPFLVELFGGRQTARTIHFILAFGLVAFAFIHVALVILSGFANNMRSMITGRFVIASKQRELHEHEPAHPSSS